MKSISLFLLGVSLAMPPAPAQSFNVGSWFFGKNVTSELPEGVTDLTDHLWASTVYTCPVVITGSRTAPAAALTCRPNDVSGRYTTVIAEGDARLQGTRLAIPTPTSADTGRYLTSVVRPGERNLYFTSITGTTAATFTNAIAWRLRNYTTLERVAGAGDTVRMFDPLTKETTQVRLSAAGPIDITQEGREFIYLEAATANRYGLFEVKADGSYTWLFSGRLTMRDTPWGMGGFIPAQNGLVFRQPSVVYRLDVNTQDRRGLTTLALEGQPFVQTPGLSPTASPNLALAQFFRAIDDPGWFLMSWAVGSPGQNTAPQVLSQWKDWIFRPSFNNSFGTPQEVTVGTFAAGDRMTLLGTAPRANTAAVDPNVRGTAPWAIDTLWTRNAGGNWVRVVGDSDLPEAGTPRRLYQGVAAYKCTAEIAAKRNDGSLDNSGPLTAYYRLYRPCIDSVDFNSISRELIVRGVNLQDQRTEIGVPLASPQADGSPNGQLLPSRVTSVTPTEVRALVEGVGTLPSVQVLINGRIWSDPVSPRISTDPAPIIRGLNDISYSGTPPSPSKLMIVAGLFGCQTAGAQSVNYPTVLGSCAVLLDNTTPLQLLYASREQINVLMPSNLAPNGHDLRVTRTDATGVFTSTPLVINASADSAVAFKDGTYLNTLVTAVRNGQLVVLGPTDAIRPGEYFTIYLTGGNLQTLALTARIGTVDVPLAAALVSWAQGVTQVNLQAPPVALGNVTVVIDRLAPFQVTIQ